MPEPQRINGRRRYEGTVLRRVAAIHRAQSAGWTLAEIKELFYGFPEEMAPSARWREMAPQKIEELDQILKQTQRMKELLEQGADCGCRSLEECDAL